VEGGGKKNASTDRVRLLTKEAIELAGGVKWMVERGAWWLERGAIKGDASNRRAMGSVVSFTYSDPHTTNRFIGGEASAGGVVTERSPPVAENVNESRALVLAPSPTTIDSAQGSSGTPRCFLHRKASEAPVFPFLAASDRFPQFPICGGPAPVHARGEDPLFLSFRKPGLVPAGQLSVKLRAYCSD
jgi:hypothetical protein